MAILWAALTSGLQMKPNSFVSAHGAFRTSPITDPCWDGTSPALSETRRGGPGGKTWLFEKKNGNRVWLNRFAWQPDKGLIPPLPREKRGPRILASDRKVERCQRRTFTTISYLFSPSPVVIHPLGGYLIACFCLEEQLSFTLGWHHLRLPAGASLNLQRSAGVAAHQGV